MITSIAIKDFRSIASAEVDANWITSFVGSNDAGKSNVLRALNLFFNGEVDRGERFDFSRDFNQFAVERVRKVPQVEITLKFQLPDGYIREGYPEQIEWTKVWRRDGQASRLEQRSYVGGEGFPPRSKIPAQLDRIVYTYVPAIKDRAFFADLQGRLYDVLSTVAEKPLKESADRFEAQLQAQVNELMVAIKAGLSSDSKMRLPSNLREIFESLEIAADGIPLSRRGDGIKIRHVPMMLRFISTKRDELLTRGGVRYTHVWGFEEPENNVEMSSAFAMAAELAEIIDDNDHIQLFLTTHSPIFYRIDNIGGDHKDLVTTHFVEKIGKESVLSQKKPEEVDETMGLMPIVAPYVREAQERFISMKAALADAQRLLDKGVPTIFVEGDLDKRVLEMAWALFSNHDGSAICFHCGGSDYGGADAARSRLVAWLLEMRHRREGDRHPVGVIFDRDEAGVKAHAKLKDDLSSLNLSKYPSTILFYQANAAIASVYKKGFDLPIDLELLYDDEVWKEAEARGWLADRENVAAIVSPGLLSRMFEERIDPLATLNVDERRRVRSKFSDSGKASAVRFIASVSEDRRRRLLANFARIISSVEQSLLSP